MSRSVASILCVQELLEVEAASPDMIMEPMYTMLAYMSAMFPAAEDDASGEVPVGVANAAFEFVVAEAELGVDDASVWLLVSDGEPRVVPPDLGEVVGFGSGTVVAGGL